MKNYTIYYKDGELCVLRTVRSYLRFYVRSKLRGYQPPAILIRHQP